MKVKVVALLISLAIIIATPAVALAQGPARPTWTSNWTDVPPDVSDGNLNTFDGEWVDAQINYVPFLGGAFTVAIYIKNDATNLYMAAQVPDPVENLGGDYIQVWFDNFQDGEALPGYEDIKMYYPGGAPEYQDLHLVINIPPWSADASVDGSGGYSHDGSQYTFEFSLPLNSGDPQDVAVSPGDMMVLMAHYFEDETDTSGFWPEDATEDLDTWGHLQLAGPPAAPTGVQVFPSLYIGLGAAFAAAVVAYFIRRRLLVQE